MSDGNTATTSQGYQGSAIISPTDAALPTEEDMGKVRAIFDQAVNALVNASKLRNEVDDLCISLDALNDQVTKVRRQNDWLDEQLVRIRGERDIAISATDCARQRMTEAETSTTLLQSQLDTAKRVMGEDQGTIDLLRKERDEAQFKAMELEEELIKVNAKLEKFLSLANEIDPPQEPTVTINTQWKSPPQQVPITEYKNEPLASGNTWDPISQSYR